MNSVGLSFQWSENWDFISWQMILDFLWSIKGFVYYTNYSFFIVGALISYFYGLTFLTVAADYSSSSSSSSYSLLI